MKNFYRYFSKTKSSLTCLATVSLLTILAPTLALAQTNLLTVNPSFEQDNGIAYHNRGSYSIPGWDFFEDTYSGNRFNVGNGDASDGTNHFYMNDGGTLETTPTARATVSPGKVYQLTFDSKKTRDDGPGKWRGIYPYVIFYDASGNPIKEVSGGEFQYSGVTPNWQIIKMRATAPAGAVKAGVRVYHNPGIYSSDLNIYDLNWRDFRVDNFKFIEAVETADFVHIRKAPRLLEKGKAITVTVRFTAPGTRKIILRLFNSANASQMESSQNVTSSGRGLLSFSVTVPSNLTAGSGYYWEARSFTAGASWSNSYLTREQSTGAFCDDTVSGSGVVYPDNSTLVYEGRGIKKTGSGSTSAAEFTWPATQMRTRFNGTKLVFCGDGVNDYNGNPAGMVAVVDGNTSNMIKFSLGPGYQEKTVVSGLTNTNHSVCIYKNASAQDPVIFRGLKFDTGKGVLKPEPARSLKIEFYGDSVTEGGVPDANATGADINDDGQWTNNSARVYGPLTGRELGADVRLIAKGGMGMQAGFIPYHLYDIWNLADFVNGNPGTTINDFSSWQPDAVVIAIGQNDQYGGSGGNPNQAEFIQRYQQQVANLRSAYPNAHIFCTNTSMTQLDFPNWEKSVVPLLEAGNADPKLHFRLFSWQNHGGHPRDFDHTGMAQGNNRWLGLADWIEETLTGLKSDGGDGKSNGGPSPVAGSVVPIGQTIALKGVNGYLVSTDLSDSGNLKAAWATGTPGTWERFRVDDAGSGKIALFSLNNNRYVTVYDNDPNKQLRADNATTIQLWELFTWETRPGTNRVALKSVVTGKYVTCNLNDGGKLIAPWADAVQSWEEFEWSAW